MIKFHQKYFIESIPFEKVNPIEKISSNFRNIHFKENKLTRFQIIHETEFANKYKNPLYKTQYSEILVEYDEGFDMTNGKKIDPNATHHLINKDTSYIPVNLRKNTGNPGGRLEPYDSESTRLQELSLMNNTYFGAIHYDIHLDMKLDYTINRIFQEMSLSEMKTLHQLCELERTQILQYSKYHTRNICYPEIDQISLTMKELFYVLYLHQKKYHHYMFSKTNVVTKESQYSTKIKNILLIHFQDEHIFGIPQSHVGQKIATTSYN